MVLSGTGTSPRLVVRTLFLVLVLLSVGVVGNAYLGSTRAQASGGGVAQQARVAARDGSSRQIVAPRANVTVISTDSNTWLGRQQQGPRSEAELMAFYPNGSVLYYNDSHTRYWGIDPSVPGRYTVMYTAADHLSKAACHAETVCTRDVVETVNLSTGTVHRLYSMITPRKESTRWHDAEYIDTNHVAIADIYRDRAFVVNTSSDLVTWAWDAQTNFNISSGGPFPTDWTHINDVDVLPDGRIMVSVRNQDVVVFLNRTTGLERNWTLGRVGDHRILYAQHNPDYIPPDHGGPAVVVADSQNNRAVEYQRTANGTWNRTWVWTDARMQWPRAAHRLPNGHTLITDSNGNRVFEVNRTGAIVWNVNVAFPFDAVRLGAGKDSAKGPSATRANLTSYHGGVDGSAGTAAPVGPFASLWLRVKRQLRGPVFSGVVYVLPVWMGAASVLAVLVGALTLVVWALAELYWAGVTATLHWPVVFHRKR